MNSQQPNFDVSFKKGSSCVSNKNFAEGIDFFEDCLKQIINQLKAG